MRAIAILLGLALVPVLLSSAAHARPGKRLDPATNTCRLLTFANSGWNSPGAHVWKETCKGCHARDNDQGAPFLHPGSKTMKAWNRVFFERYPKCARSGAWDKLSQEELLSLNDYLFVHAYNAYDPNDAADCG
ncbi:MAG: hypothetical protein AB1568_17085 [Thermodesulfobacteriota bacterium]